MRGASCRRVGDIAPAHRILLAERSRREDPCFLQREGHPSVRVRASGRKSAPATVQHPEKSTSRARTQACRSTTASAPVPSLLRLLRRVRLVLPTVAGPRGLRRRGHGSCRDRSARAPATARRSSPLSIVRSSTACVTSSIAASSRARPTSRRSSLARTACCTPSRRRYCRPASGIRRQRRHSRVIDHRRWWRRCTIKCPSAGMMHRRTSARRLSLAKTAVRPERLLAVARPAPPCTSRPCHRCQSAAANSARQQLRGRPRRWSSIAQL